MLSVSAAIPPPVVALDEPEIHAQYNPKELGVDKSVPWSRRFMDYTDDACNAVAHGVIESVSTKYTMFLPDGTPCARSVAFPGSDGSSKDLCALTTTFFRPNPTSDAALWRGHR